MYHHNILTIFSHHTPCHHCSHYTCYRTELVPNPINPYEPHLLTQEKILPLGDHLYKIFSPNFDGQTPYPNSTLCKYSFPECPAGYIQQIVWSDHDFQLEPPLPFCLDFVQLFLSSFDLETSGASLDLISLPEQILCGAQGIFHVELNTNMAVHVRAVGTVCRCWSIYFLHCCSLLISQIQL